MSNENHPNAEAALAPQGSSGAASVQSPSSASIAGVPSSIEVSTSGSESPLVSSHKPIESRLPQSDWAPKLDASGCVQPFDVYEAQIFRFALANAGGCVSRAAEMLGVGRATMYRKMRAYEIIAPPVSERAIDRSRRSMVRAQPQPSASQDSSFRAA